MPVPLMTSTLAFIGGIGTTELIILALFGLLIFGKRLPEVGKGIGRGIVEFKRSLSGIEEYISDAAHQPPQTEKLKPSTASADASERDKSLVPHGSA